MFSLEHRRKIGEALRGRKLSLEHRRAISNGLKKSDKVLRGDDNPAKRPEVRKKISNAHKGKVLSAETRKKMSEAHKGEKKSGHSKLMKERHKRGLISVEPLIKFREKNPDFGKGEKHPFYGKRRPEHSKRMMGKNNPMYRKKLCGKANPFYGKKHSKQSKEKMSRARWEFQKKHPEKHPNSILAKKGGVSKPQKWLYECLLKFFGKGASLNHYVRTFDNIRFIDVAVPSELLAFEYDGPRWHDEVADSKRDWELLEVGWFTVRIDDRGKLIFGGGVF